MLLAIGWIWSGVYADPRLWAMAALVALVAAPALVQWWRRGARALTVSVLLAPVTVIGVAAIASRQNPGALLSFDHDAWAAVGRVVRDGFVESNRAVAPVAWGAAPAFVGLLDVVWALIGASVLGAVAVRGRPAVAVATMVAGAAYRWTVAPPASPVLEGLVLVGAAIAGLFLVREPQNRGLSARGPRGAAVLAAGALGVALVAGLAIGNTGRWWNWEKWGFQGRQAGEVGTLSTAQNYGQLEWPAEPRLVMTVSGSEPLPMEATVLTAFDGAAFVDASQWGLPQPTRTVDMAGGRAQIDSVRPNDGEPVVQRVELARTRTNLLFAGGRPVELAAPIQGPLTVMNDRTLITSPAVGPDFSYAVRVVVNDPDPDALRAAERYDSSTPPDMTTLRPYMGSTATTGSGAPYTVPLWPAGLDREIPGRALGNYERVRELTREVVGDAATPYVAVNRIESYLRDPARFTYDEKPPDPGGESPLEAFLFTNQRGFCQHFAGSMALMLRTVGIPSRVAVGYAPGRFDTGSDRWEIVDRDAHSWVEAYLPGAGWVAFDPTPGRYFPNRASVGSPDYTPPEPTGRAQDDVAQSPVNVPQDARPTRSTPEPVLTTELPATPPAAAPSRRVPRWVWAALGLVALAAALVLARPAGRALRRARERRRGGPRERVLAAVRAFEDDLGRLGHPAPTHLDAQGRAAHVHDAVGLDPSRLYALAESARYAGDAHEAEADAAWREVARLARDTRTRLARGPRVRAYLGLRPRPARGRAPRASRQATSRRRGAPRDPRARR